MVRTQQGEIEIDDTGKRDGRGAYVCPTRQCLEKALKGNQLEHILRSRIMGESREKLTKYLTDFSGGAD
jgi:predicted RNA-binding protein YlxR (DUF448 family)